MEEEKVSKNLLILPNSEKMDKNKNACCMKLTHLKEETAET